MMASLILRSVLFLGLQTILVSCCENDSDCNNVGTCTKSGRCHCPFGYSGASCGFNFSSDSKWLAAYYTMGAITSFLNLGIVIWAVYLLKSKIQFKQGTWELKKPWNILHTMLVLLISAASIRVIWGVLDPRSIRGISPRGFDVFLYYMPLLLLFEIDFCLTVLWMSLQSMSGVKKVANPQRSKKLMIAFFIFSFVILVPAVIFQVSSNDSEIASLLNNIAQGLLLLIIAVFGVTYGFKFRVILVDILKANRSKIILKMYDATQLVLCVNLMVLGIIIVVIIDAGLGNWTYPFLSVGFHMFYRLGELIFEGSILWMTKRINPSSSPDSSIQSVELSVQPSSNIYSSQ